jgi:hypothetical protein
MFWTKSRNPVILTATYDHQDPLDLTFNLHLATVQISETAGICSKPILYENHELKVTRLS